MLVVFFDSDEESREDSFGACLWQDVGKTLPEFAFFLASSSPVFGLLGLAAGVGFFLLLAVRRDVGDSHVLLLGDELCEDAQHVVALDQEGLVVLVLAAEEGGDQQIQVLLGLDA